MRGVTAIQVSEVGGGTGAGRDAREGDADDQQSCSGLATQLVGDLDEMQISLSPILVCGSQKKKPKFQASPGGTSLSHVHRGALYSYI